MSGRTVLFIDDEADQLLMVRTRLEAQGLQVITAMDGEEGLRRARTEQPDVILLDVRIPKIDGPEVCRWLKLNKETREIPVIMFTASVGRDLEETCKAVGADACLRKPYESAELVALINLFLGTS